jgi:hypothetical protein
MAATWEINDVRFVNRARREVSVTATATKDGTSRPYTLASFIINDDEEPSDEADRLVADLGKMFLADKAWNQPDLATLFPNAAVVLKAKLDALEL